MDEKKRALPVLEIPRTVGCAFSFENENGLLNIISHDETELVRVLNVLMTAPAIADFLKIEKTKKEDE